MVHRSKKGPSVLKSPVQPSARSGIRLTDGIGFMDEVTGGLEPITTGTPALVAGDAIALFRLGGISPVIPPKSYWKPKLS